MLIAKTFDPQQIYNFIAQNGFEVLGESDRLIDVGMPTGWIARTRETCGSENRWERNAGMKRTNCEYEIFDPQGVNRLYGSIHGTQDGGYNYGVVQTVSEADQKRFSTLQERVNQDARLKSTSHKLYDHTGKEITLPADPRAYSIYKPRATYRWGGDFVDGPFYSFDVALNKVEKLGLDKVKLEAGLFNMTLYRDKVAAFPHADSYPDLKAKLENRGYKVRAFDPSKDIV